MRASGAVVVADSDSALLQLGTISTTGHKKEAAGQWSVGSD